MESSLRLSTNSQYTLTPAPDAQALRLDKYISNFFPSYSRTFFQKLIEKSCIWVNGIIVTKSSILVQHPDIITIYIPLQADTHDFKDSTHLNIEILYTHEHFFIINKPANVIVHTTDTQPSTATLVDWIVQKWPEMSHIGYVDRPGIVHRLDKDTSGIMIIARTNYAHKMMQELFRERTISKTYYALVQGHPSPTGTIDLPIGRNPVHRHLMTHFKPESIQDGSLNVRPATTHYKVLNYYQDCSLLEVKPVTGRTHQIRVHCAAIGHPIIGDRMYGKKSSLIDRQALHAYALSFELDGISYQFTCPLPSDMTTLLSNLNSLTT